jgi:hypothetical protein
MVQRHRCRVQPTSVASQPALTCFQEISNLRAKLSKAADDQGIVTTTPGGVNLVTTVLLTHVTLGFPEAVALRNWLRVPCHTATSVQGLEGNPVTRTAGGD